MPFESVAGNAGEAAVRSWKMSFASTIRSTVPERGAPQSLGWTWVAPSSRTKRIGPTVGSVSSK